MSWTRGHLPGQETRLAFALAVVSAARNDVGRVYESDGPNDSPEIRSALAEVGIGRPANYCAAIVSKWLREAACAVGLDVPPFQSPGAKALIQMGARLGLRTREPALGALVVWDRSTFGKPETQWQGHVEIVSAAPRNGSGRVIWWETIGGNTADPLSPRDPLMQGVHVFSRDVDELVTDKRLLGFVDWAH